MTGELFPDAPTPVGDEVLAPGAMLLRGYAVGRAEALVAAVEEVQSRVPFVHLVTPGGHTMSVAMTNCGRVGWVSDRRGYRYAATRPGTDQPWPDMPDVLRELAEEAARRSGFPDFDPDACLINRYEPGARMSLHQDRDENDRQAPIVSVSLGLPAVFQFGGFQRSDRPARIPLAHGDVVVWGGPSRMRFHGVLAVKPGDHPLLGNCRINLTFRKVF
ncbi:DNA oxidative demethylase AlkB [Alkalisalibacterium limincola]|uniref:DNA oxidative demethylase AlkB n=1 Tax=Alkalisalibacterium limincola TaxID=2699169 RepID=A0A5C8KRN8_9GAMM|nr:DNA oxidative demethylase AlkB [Alkalisalibacterium limincola]TXK62615.1 DNA oxidative demethylase AlkB [Alkalisalibacterium limincola]